MEPPVFSVFGKLLNDLLQTEMETWLLLNYHIGNRKYVAMDAAVQVKSPQCTRARHHLVIQTCVSPHTGASALARTGRALSADITGAAS